MTDSVTTGKRKKFFKGLKKDDISVHVILIGQLGKYIDDNSKTYGETSMECILDYAFGIINQVNDRIPCSCVLIECKSCEAVSKNEKPHRLALHEKYKKYGFSELQTHGDLIEYVIFI